MKVIKDYRASHKRMVTTFRSAIANSKLGDAVVTLIVAYLTSMEEYADKLITIVEDRHTQDSRRIQELKDREKYNSRIHIRLFNKNIIDIKL